MGKKNKKIKTIEYRTKEERQLETRPIILKLTELNLTVKYESIKILMSQLSDYIQNGNRIVLDMQCPDINRRIKGVLATDKKEEVWVVLKAANDDD